MDSNSQPTRQIYKVLVAGDIDLTKFEIGIKVEPYVLYRYKDREAIQHQTIELYRSILNETPFPTSSQQSVVENIIRLNLHAIENMTPEEFFEDLTQGCTYDDDSGDAISDINPDGKWVHLIAPTLETTVPLFNSEETPFEGLKSNVIPDVAANEKDINNALFYNAFVSEKTGWLEQCDEDQVQWALTFYERFIEPLAGDTKLKVYNYIR